MASKKKGIRPGIPLLCLLAIGCSEHCKSQGQAKTWYVDQLQDAGSVTDLAPPMTPRTWALVTSAGFFVSLEWITVGTSGQAYFRSQRIAETPLYAVTYSSGGPRSTLSDVWAVGAQGTLRRSDMETTPPVWGTELITIQANLNGVASVPPSLRELWVVGDDGTTVHHDGLNTVVEVIAEEDLIGVWASDSEVWAVGDGQDVLFHRVSGAWRREQLTFGAELVAVAGSARDDVWFVGKKGVIVRWDGARFVSIAVPGIAADLNAVTVGVEGTWIAGADGTLLLLPKGTSAPEIFRVEPITGANWVAIASTPTVTSPSLDSVTLVAEDGTVALYEMPEQLYDVCGI